MVGLEGELFIWIEYNFSKACNTCYAFLMLRESVQTHTDRQWILLKILVLMDFLMSPETPKITSLLVLLMSVITKACRAWLCIIKIGISQGDPQTQVECNWGEILVIFSPMREGLYNSKPASWFQPLFLPQLAQLLFIQNAVLLGNYLKLVSDSLLSVV